MPLYEYRCESCGHTQEAIQSFSEPPLTVCERCGGALKKQMSAPAVQFKGSGWYVSDYGKSGSRSETKSEGSSESKTETSKSDGKAEGKSESKPESKSETKSDTAKKPDAA